MRQGMLVIRRVREALLQDVELVAGTLFIITLVMAWLAPTSIPLGAQGFIGIAAFACGLIVGRGELTDGLTITAIVLGCAGAVGAIDPSVGDVIQRHAGTVAGLAVAFMAGSAVAMAIRPEKAQGES